MPPPRQAQAREFPGLDDGITVEYVPDSYQIDNGDVPLVPFGGRTIPLFAPIGMRSWALVNLILAVLGVILALFLAAHALLRRRSDNRLDAPDGAEYEVDRHYRKYRPIWLAVACVAGLLGILLFVLTQDMSAMMALMDRWTILQAVIFAAEIVATIFKQKRSKDTKRPQYA